MLADTLVDVSADSLADLLARDGVSYFNRYFSYRPIILFNKKDVQARTGRIGLAHFLNKARVPGYETAACRCGLGDETAEHLLLHC